MRRLSKPIEWDRERIQNLLATNDAACERALMVLMNGQEKDEIQELTTKYHNNRGFSIVDAPIMTKLATKLRKGERLNPTDLRWLRSQPNKRQHSRIGKYHRQLLEEIARKAGLQRKLI